MVILSERAAVIKIVAGILPCPVSLSTRLQLTCSTLPLLRNRPLPTKRVTNPTQPREWPRPRIPDPAQSLASHPLFQPDAYCTQSCQPVSSPLANTFLRQLVSLDHISSIKFLAAPSVASLISACYNHSSYFHWLSTLVIVILGYINSCQLSPGFRSWFLGASLFL